MTQDRYAAVPDRRPDISRGPCSHDHSNPYCQCNTSDEQRAEMLREYLDALDSVCPDPLLMPRSDDGKDPIIVDRCRLDTEQARSYLVDGDEAVRHIREEGARGFYIYAGKPDHGTERIVFADRDDPSRWPFIDDTLRVMSGSGKSDHETYINAGGVENAHGKGELKGAGSIHSHNVGVVVPGSIHPSRGIYHVIADSEPAELYPDDLPAELRPGSLAGGSGGTSSDSTERVEIDDLPENFNPDLVMNDEGVPLDTIRTFSSRLDRLLNHFDLTDFESPSEEDMAAVRLLLYWRFDAPDIALILKSCRNRRKVRRDGYIRRTIARTVIDEPIDKNLMKPLVDAAMDNGGRSPIGPESLQEARDALRAIGGEATTTELIDSPHVEWGDAKKDSVRRRLNRALDLQEKAGYVTKTKDRGRNVWTADGLDGLTLPTDHL